MGSPAMTLGTRLGINLDDYRPALNALASGRLAWVVVGGKMTAGKDTVAPELVDILPGDVEMLRYGNLMRAELDPALDLLRHEYQRGQLLPALRPALAARISYMMDLRPQWATELVDTLAPEMEASKGTLTAHSRTDGNRSILQNLGEPWRCEDDADYWARPAAIAALEAVKAGKSVILTGGRYLPDVEIPRAANALLVRLDVTRATQLDRLSTRDGLGIDPDTLAALDHRGETALDDYAHFDVRVDNDGALEDCLAQVRGGVWNNIARRGTYVA